MASEIEKEIQQRPMPVVVTDFNMPFGAMIGFMVKWAIAAIPAAMILFFITIFLGAMVKGCLSP